LLTDLCYRCEIEDAAERIDAIAANDRQALVLARRDGAVCGLVALDFMYYLPLGTITCRVTALVVTPTAQGLGIGRQLLKEAERRARSGGAARIELTSGSQRTEAHAFYRACGYKDSSVRFVKQLGA
ncbi:MAG TPA: GNAT family N-acetyltransferase, partial [Thermomonas sp.]|nr:GNAT family N-acetyltransferase [Thermomonas sp.]